MDDLPIKRFGIPDEAARIQWEADGCRGVAIGVETPTMTAGKWAGHLAVVIRNQFGDRHAVLDLTLPQANKPEWGINLATGALRVSDSFVTGAAEYKAVIGGSLLVYKAFPTDSTYMAAPVWQDTALRDQVVGRALADL